MIADQLVSDEALEEHADEAFDTLLERVEEALAAPPTLLEPEVVLEGADVVAAGVELLAQPNLVPGLQIGEREPGLDGVPHDEGEQHEGQGGHRAQRPLAKEEQGALAHQG